MMVAHGVTVDWMGLLAAPGLGGLQTQGQPYTHGPSSLLVRCWRPSAEERWKIAAVRCCHLNADRGFGSIWDFWNVLFW